MKTRNIKFQIKVITYDFRSSTIFHSPKPRSAKYSYKIAPTQHRQISQRRESGIRICNLGIVNEVNIIYPWDFHTYNFQNQRNQAHTI